MEESLFQEKLAEYTELVKDVDIEDVCEYEGIEVKNIRGHKQILCPFHNDQNYGSCFIKNNRIHCFSCGESADSIKLVRHIENLSFVDALRVIGEIGGLPELIFSNEQKVPEPNPMFLTDKQIKILGFDLKKHSIFCVSNHTDDPTYFGGEAKSPYMDADGYLVGHYQKTGLKDLFIEDQVGFNYMMLGKCHELLVDALSEYELKHYQSRNQQEDLENQIEELIQIANIYRPVATTYGFDLNFIDSYHRHPKFTFQAQF